jgi:hypothetical protein
MAKILRSDISSLLNEIAQALDIPDSLYEAAESKYRAVGAWLGGKDSPLASFSPQIYPQGSFQLGTVTKPLSEEYDIDVVFEMALSKNDISQQTLKNMVGRRLKANETYLKMLDEEGRRCWTLQYADSAQFHMDILPAIPDLTTYPILEAQGVPPILARTSLAFTDKNYPNYTQIHPDWPRGNPKGYAAWFRQQMIIRYDALRKQFAEAYKSQIENVPEYRVKTPLQRCVQLLKRHRNIKFANDLKVKPASIILTTLAARAYSNQADITDTLVSVIDGMPHFIFSMNGISWVANPVDPTENFADRWRENPRREPVFKAWLSEIRTELAALLNCDDINEISKLLVSMFGEKVATAVVDRYKETSLSRKVLSGTVASPRPVVTIRDPNKPWGR